LPKQDEDTLVIVKPDGVAQKLGDRIKAIYVKRGLRIVAEHQARYLSPFWMEFYAEHRSRHYFDQLVNFMVSGPVLFLRLRGPNAVKLVRQLNGVTDPIKRTKTSIRGQWAKGKVGPDNIVHGSDSPESAQRELRLLPQLGGPAPFRAK
jgi:nucleoside-diphosphate kinase